MSAVTLVRRFDFGALGAPRVMTSELALAFRGHLADKSPAVWSATFVGHSALAALSLRTRSWAARIESLREVDRAMLCEFIAWLDHQPHRIGTRYTSLVGVQAAARVAAASPSRAGASRTRVSIQPFPAQERRGASTRGAVTRRARRGAGRMRAGYRSRVGRPSATGERLSRRSIAPRSPAFGLNRLNLDHLGVLLAVLHDRFGGLVPPQRAFVGRRAGHSSLLHAIQRRGGTGVVSRYLHADPVMLIPLHDRDRGPDLRQPRSVAPHAARLHERASDARRPRGGQLVEGPRLRAYSGAASCAIGRFRCPT